MREPGEVRRVVLGTGDDGRSRVVHDGHAPVVHTFPGAEGFAVAEIWGSDDVPPPTNGDEPTLVRTAVDTDLAAGALRFRVVDWPESTDVPPIWHSTPTIDFLVVLDGAIRLLLDDGEVELHAGDTVVQLANVHAWQVIEGARCRVAFVNVGLG